MKVLCEFAPCGPAYVRSGWGRVFEACGHSFTFWDPSRKSAFDAFAEAEPQIFIGTTYGLDRAIHRCIQARPGIKVALFASAWGPLVENIDRQKYPIVIVGDEEKKRVEALQKETSSVSFVFVHVSDKYLDGTMGGWKEVGVKPIGVMNAADTFVYYPVPPGPEYECDAMMCGGFWGYKGRNLTSFVLPLAQKFRTKFYGNRPWPTPAYVGYLHDDEVRTAMCSAKVCLSASEPHSTDLGWDCITRPFSALACGMPCVSDWVSEFAECFAPGELWMTRSPKEYADMVGRLLRWPDMAKELGRNGRARVLRDHTYFDRVSKMLAHMGLPVEANKVMEKKGELLGQP